jgi:Family of unknown function (DUF5996)
MPERLRGWPPLPLDEWQATRDTLQLWTQIVGKVRLANEPLANHWWNVTLYLTARGFTTSVMPHRTGPDFQVDFDFLSHRLDIATTMGDSRSLVLGPRSVSDFYGEFTQRLDELGVGTPIWPVPVELVDAIPFPDDEIHAAYDPEQAQRFWLALLNVERVFKDFRSRYVGKVSPVHLFWGALDLAVSRFSGRSAPEHPGGAPNCGPHVMHEAYSKEVSSAGYWPGGGGEGVFYSYAYPEPHGYRDFETHARYDEELGEYVLPYADVRTATDPDALLLEFLERTYLAAAIPAGWDRDALERDTPGQV